MGGVTFLESCCVHNIFLARHYQERNHNTVILVLNACICSLVGVCVMERVCIFGSCLLGCLFALVTVIMAEVESLDLDTTIDDDVSFQELDMDVDGQEGEGVDVSGNQGADTISHMTDTISLMTDTISQMSTDEPDGKSTGKRKKKASHNKIIQDGKSCCPLILPLDLDLVFLVITRSSKMVRVVVP